MCDKPNWNAILEFGVGGNFVRRKWQVAGNEKGIEIGKSERIGDGNVIEIKIERYSRVWSMIKERKHIFVRLREERMNPRRKVTKSYQKYE